TDPKALFIVAAIIGWTAYSYLSAWMNHRYEASFNAILSQLATVFSVFLGVFFLKEVLSLPNSIGILLILLGNVLLASKQAEIKFNNVLLMRIGMSLILALCFMFDNIASPFFNRSIYIFLAYFIPGIVLWVFVPGINWKTIVTTIKENGKDVSLLSLSSLGGYYFLLKAYDVGQLALIIPIIQSSTVSTVIGATFLLNEKKNITLKVLTGIMVTVGVIIVSLYS
ncbi:MAG: EamA family transporter, partial [Microgenomates group bacterium]